MKISIAQISPVWLNKKATTEKILSYIDMAIAHNCRLVCFGETLLPGYPFWVELTDGAKFESSIQKDLYAHYLHQGVNIENGDLDPICRKAKEGNIAIYLGCAERASDRGGHSIYCSLVYINQQGEIKSVHRKLMPTFEERLVWAIGDGNGLVTHQLEEFVTGGLNCWENWMPLPRAALYAQGENLHVSVWPGNVRNTVDLTRHIAREARSYVISACSTMSKESISDDIPHADLIRKNAHEWMGDGGSCLAAPDGSWIIPPLAKKEQLLVAEIDLNEVYKERNNFDPSGHYSRPDVIQISLNRERQKIIK
jgi:nitrilase